MTCQEADALKSQVRAKKAVLQADALKAALVYRDCKRFSDAVAMLVYAASAQALQQDESKKTEILQQHALCLSKDRGLSAEENYRLAMEVLTKADLYTTSDPETLGIAGGIAKRYWDFNGQRNRLDEARSFYERAWTARGTSDDGYTGINYAYLLNVSAHAEEAAAGGQTAISQSNRKKAQDVRAAIVEDALLPARLRQIPAGNARYWLLVTLGEANFGLALDDASHFAQAEDYIRQAADLRMPEWMIETTARQLSALARLHQLANKQITDRAWKSLELLVGGKALALRTEVGGKLGLALSGGGFRASLFHIGVLARLAELDMLRHVELLSCVSGGAILGAMYYLKLKDLLETHTDVEIESSDYVKLVQKLEGEFLSAVQRTNLRLRVIENRVENRRMLQGQKSRTERMAELLDQIFYGSDGKTMNDMEIKPKDADSNLAPKDYNWGRRNKVPLLVLNSTCLNTGHAWQFTPFGMGEPPITAETVVDSNRRIPWAPYQISVPLGRAVAASACVPALFEPIGPLPNAQLAEHVLLVDGGVQDNQGSLALLENDCTVLFVSDGSSQLADNPTTNSSFLPVAVRADDILQERLRIALYQSLEARRRSSLLRSVLFLHLKMGLRDVERNKTTYGLNADLQRKIAAIRTDLDVFHDVEAFALMYGGYHMATAAIRQAQPDSEQDDLSRAQWMFLSAQDAMTKGGSKALTRLLGYSASRLFKVWFVVPILKRTGITLSIGLAGMALWALSIALKSNHVVKISSLVWSLAVAAIVYLLTKLGVRIPNWEKEAAKLFLAFTGEFIAILHKRWLDPTYLRAGARRRFKA